jgi:hypothetical protein
VLLYTTETRFSHEEKERKVMKNLRMLVVALVVLFLAGCEVYVYGGLEPFALESAGYRTNYLYNNSSVVCDDRTTEFEVALGYRGEIEFVSIGLVGNNSGERYSLGSFSPSTSENENGLVRRTFSVRRGVSPLGVSSTTMATAEFSAIEQGVSPQSIIVVPVDPQIIGYTILELRIETRDGDYNSRSRNIPVFDYCD